MPNGDPGLAQAIYLAQMFAQRKSCTCKACLLLRQATDGMIEQMLSKAPPPAGEEAAKALRHALEAQASLPSDERGEE